MNRDVRELFKLYEQTVSVGNIQLQNPQPSVSVGGTQLRNDPYNIQVPVTTPAYGPAGVAPQQGFDYEGAKKDWRAFQEENFLLAMVIQILDPTTITSWPDVEDSYNLMMNKDSRPDWGRDNTFFDMDVLFVAYFLFNLFAAIPLWVPFAGQIGKILGLAKGGVAAGKVAPKAVVPALELAFKGAKTPLGKKFVAGVLERAGKDPASIEAVMKAIDSADATKMVKALSEKLGIPSDQATKILDDAAKQTEEVKKVLPKGTIQNTVDVALKMSGDPAILDTTGPGLVAKVKYWLGTAGKGGDEATAIKYLKDGKYDDLPADLKELVKNIAKNYGVKESDLPEFFKIIWPGELTAKAITDTASKISGDVVSSTAARAGAEAGAEVGASGVREIDRIAQEFERPIEMLGRSDLPKSMQSTVDRVKAKGGRVLASALQKIANRNLKKGEAILTRAEKEALEKAARSLEENGIIGKLASKAGRLAVGTGKVALLKGFIALKAAAALQHWLKKQYKKGKAYRPTEPKKIQVTGLPSGYTSQGSTTANPQGRNAPNAQNIYPPTSTANQYQYKPVKWWSTQ